MIKSKIPVPAKSACSSSIPVPVKNKVGEENKIKPPLKKSSVIEPCSTRQVKLKLSSVKSDSTSTRVKTTALSKPPKKPISTYNQHVRQVKVQPLSPKHVKKPITSVSANIKHRKTITQSAVALKAKTQKTTGTSITNQNVKMYKNTKQPEPKIKLKNESKWPDKAPVSKHAPRVNSTNQASKDKEENVELGAKKLQKMKPNFGVSDSEFAASDFFKTLILSEKELSPSTMKMCSETKCPSTDVDYQTPAEKLLSQYKSLDDFAKDVRKTSSKYTKTNGKNVLPSAMVIQTSRESKLADDFVEDVRRISEKFFKKFGPNSPIMQYRRNIRTPLNRKNLKMSIKENLNCQLLNAQNIASVIKKNTLSKTTSQLNLDPALRRWTCNTSSISHVNPFQIADGIRRFSLIGKDSVHNQPLKLQNEYNCPENASVSKHARRVTSTNQASKDKEENVELGAKKLQKMKPNFGVSDSEFLASDFFKTLILSEKELSPSTMKMCSETKCPSTDVIQTSRESKSADDLVEDVRRISEKFFKKLGPNSPMMQYRRNIRSPLHHKNFKMSIKENLNCQVLNAQNKASIIKKNTLSKTSSLLNLDPAQRRWTCNTSSISHITPSQIANEIRRLSLIGKDSVHKQPLKTSVLMNKNCYEATNPEIEVLEKIETLRSKKVNKVKKKVTFSIPDENSPDLPILSDEINHKKSRSKLSDIPEDDSLTSTPELDWNLCKKNSQPGENKISLDDSTDTTPELNLSPFRSRSKLSLKNTETFNLDCGFQNIPVITVSTCDKVDKLITCKRTPNLHKNDSISDSQSLERLSISPSNEKYQLSIINESKGFCVNDRKLFTPHPTASHRKSDHSRAESSPSFLPGKYIDLDSLAPICTPYVLKNLCNSSDNDLNSVRQKLNFGENVKLSEERRESQIIVKNIPTAQKMLECLCDEECRILSSLSSITEISMRKLMNPIAKTLSKGDEMHFVPISSP